MASKSEPSPNDPWLARTYADYYHRNPPRIPDRFGKREFGFLFFGQKMMMRHVAFPRVADFERFHSDRGPAHSYYSTAYYKDPGAPTMAEKGWLGAELIFDLDADHVPGAEKLSYPQQLARVKEHFIRLVDEFVRRDFGFEEKDLLLTFSGGRGYHCHVMSEKALELSSQERREIVDYITGTGLDLGVFMREETKARAKRGNYAQTRKTLRIASRVSPGWGARLNQGLETYVQRLKALPAEEAAKEFAQTPGIGKKGLSQLLEEMNRLDSERIERMKLGYADQGDLIKKLVPVVLREQVIPLAKGETDEPVTSDVKRLIRTPGSLHGKSGLRVTILSRNELDAFDPLMDAIAFGEEPVAMEVTRDVTVSHGGLNQKFQPGRATMPLYAAVFVALINAGRPARGVEA